LHYEIIDIIGQNVLNGKVINFIDVENLNNGFYFLKLKPTTEYRYITKFEKIE
jgi:hypothetical protein